MAELARIRHLTTGKTKDVILSDAGRSAHYLASGEWQILSRSPLPPRRSIRQQGVREPLRKHDVIHFAHAHIRDQRAGAEATADALLAHLASNGLDVALWMIGDIADTYEHNGVTVYGASRMLRDLGKWACVVTGQLAQAENAISGANAAGIPSVFYADNELDITKAMLRRHPPKLLVANTQWVADSMATLGLPTIVVRPPVNPADYATTPGDMVTVVNLFEPKGGAVLAQLAKRMPDVSFLGVQGSYGEQVHQDSPNVEVIPSASDMRQVYGRTRILLAPSRYESFGRVALEACASGIPVIASMAPGFRESLGTSATFVDVDDLDGWQAAISRLLKPRSWAAASRKALAQSERMDPAEDLARWHSAITELIGGSNGFRDRD